MPTPRMVREPSDGRLTQQGAAMLFLLTTTVAAAGGAALVLLLQHRGALPPPSRRQAPRSPSKGKAVHTAPVGSPSKSDSNRDTMPVEGSEDIFPPLPPTVVALLHSTRVCHLSTTSSDGLPHLSLMRFTYRQEEEVIIMTTRTDTKKYELLCSSPKVAVLVHDFPSSRKEEEEEGGGEGGGEGGSTVRGVREGAGEGHTYAITLNGVAHMQKGKEAERFRALHLENNIAYSQFIEGEKIAVFTVHVTSARICNVEDRVTYWDKHTAIKAAKEKEEET